jgi:ubiquitin carboxyl-terminal hydrolase 48
MGKKPGKRTAPQPRVLPGALVIGVDDARHYRDLLNNQGLSNQDRLAILNADGKGKTVASNRDPLFFDDLIPSNFRREGIWQRSLSAIVDAEPTSAKARRDVYDTPAGLTNLGNTCYANSALQVLYTNKVFREAIYNVEEDVVEGDVSGMLSELRKLFLDMQFCDYAIADPRAFANMLKLQASEQQDAQEFQKLLMQRLEERVQRSAKPQVRTLPHACAGPAIHSFK